VGLVLFVVGGAIRSDRNPIECSGEWDVGVATEGNSLGSEFALCEWFSLIILPEYAPFAGAFVWQDFPFRSCAVGTNERVAA
jgi:hypothetical protein